MIGNCVLDFNRSMSSLFEGALLLADMGGAALFSALGSHAMPNQYQR